jgi:enterochelin esterase family protein
MRKLRIVIALALLWALPAFSCAATPADAQPEPESPRLRALAAALAAADPNAVQAFWQEIGSKSPLIEAIPDRPRDALFTFVWHARPGQVALNVLFNGWFPLHRPSGFDSFTRLRDSDVWYTSYVLPRGSHLRYELIAPKGWHAAADRATYFTMGDTEYETFHDPLNARVMDWNNSVVAYAEGPQAKTSAYLGKRPGIASGTLQSLTVNSAILGHPYTLQIYVPPDYRATSHDYGLLLAYDGNQYTTAVPTPTILDNMIAAHVIAPVLAVFLESPDRDVEFPPNDAFQRFIATELLPQLRQHYRISHDPRRNAVLGSSYGGLAATYTAFTHPELFGNVISQSGSYGWSPQPQDPGATAPPRGINTDTGWLIRRIAESPARKIRFYLDAGSWEGNTLLFSNRLLRAVLVGKGDPVIYSETEGTHSSFYWMLRLPAGLEATLGR